MLNMSSHKPHMRPGYPPVWPSRMEWYLLLFCVGVAVGTFLFLFVEITAQ